MNSARNFFALHLITHFDAAFEEKQLAVETERHVLTEASHQNTVCKNKEIFVRTYVLKTTSLQEQALADLQQKLEAEHLDEIEQIYDKLVQPTIFHHFIYST